VPLLGRNPGDANGYISWSLQEIVEILITIVLLRCYRVKVVYVLFRAVIIIVLLVLCTAYFSDLMPLVGSLEWHLAAPLGPDLLDYLC